MARIATAERELYTDVWQTVDRYADYAPGAEFVEMFASIIGPASSVGYFAKPSSSKWTRSVLDAGCGSGRGGVGLASRGYDVWLCDLTDAGLAEDAKTLPFREACLWQPMKPQIGRLVDHVYCCDVLEHIPPQFTMLAVARMLEVVRHGVFLSVCLHADNFGLVVGTPLHQTIHEFVWWRDSLRELGHLTEARDLIGQAAFYLERR